MEEVTAARTTDEAEDLNESVKEPEDVNESVSSVVQLSRVETARSFRETIEFPEVIRLREKAIGSNVQNSFDIEFEQTLEIPEQLIQPMEMQSYSLVKMAFTPSPEISISTGEHIEEILISESPPTISDSAEIMQMTASLVSYEFIAEPVVKSQESPLLTSEDNQIISMNETIETLETIAAQEIVTSTEQLVSIESYIDELTEGTLRTLVTTGEYRANHIYYSLY